jgi:DNA-binding CsgD family transcriptional regulator
MLRIAGRRVDARDPLRRGLDLADRNGALVLAARAREELVAAGGRPRRRRLWGVEALTPSERRVAGLVASGMSNREAAEALFVTKKAVEFHLGNVYRKLGVSGRDHLAAALEHADR